MLPRASAAQCLCIHQGGNKKKGSDKEAKRGVEKGLTGKEQVRVMNRFREGRGRELLVSTSAAEEGLDVPTCEFVVRYNAPKTGIQRIQSRGRARAIASEYFQIVQRETLDMHMHKKSHLEEMVTARVLKQCSTMAGPAAAGGADARTGTSAGSMQRRQVPGMDYY